MEEFMSKFESDSNSYIVSEAYGSSDEAVYHFGVNNSYTNRSIPCYLVTTDGAFPVVQFPSIILYLEASIGYLLNEKEVLLCDINSIPKKEELYSRNKGLLELDILEKKRVAILGLGSFGSFIAVELAKAGVGEFILIDFDRLEPSNIARHFCGIPDLGRLKVDAVRDAIYSKNPFAKITSLAKNINDLSNELEGIILEADLVICVTDNNRSRFNINEIALKLNKTVLYGRAITRAEGGDVFRMKGNAGPCYCCLIGDDGKMKFSGEEEISSERQTSELPAYVTEADRNARIQPGLSADIMPICNLLVKLALMELSDSDEELNYPFYIWANRRENFYSNWSAFDKQDKRPTILRWYGVRISKNPECSVCS
ncbi:MAG: ThiF family adenylyltransferase [Ferruginibacter sp.]